MSKKVGVLVVDDSPICRQLICDALARDPDLEVVGTAASGEEALLKVAQLKPSVVTMDVDMPGMDGLTATEQIMASQPTPILVLTADPRHEAPELTHRALAVGALALQVKPALDAGPEAWNLAREVKLLASVKVIRHLRGVKKGGEAGAPALSGLTASPVGVVVVAASTGGPQMVHRLLSELPADFPSPLVVVQHINSAFADSLVGWLQSATKLKVKAPKDGELLTPGTVLIAAPGAQLTIPSRGRVAVLPAEGQDAQAAPSATLLFQTAARAYGRRAVGVVLTGMGADGADGAVAIKQAGGRVLAQSQESCVVFGMPAAALAKGGVSHVVAGEEMAAALMKLMRGEELPPR